MLHFLCYHNINGINRRFAEMAAINHFFVRFHCCAAIMKWEIEGNDEENHQQETTMTDIFRLIDLVKDRIQIQQRKRSEEEYSRERKLMTGQTTKKECDNWEENDRQNRRERGSGGWGDGDEMSLAGGRGGKDRRDSESALSLYVSGFLLLAKHFKSKTNDTGKPFSLPYFSFYYNHFLDSRER